MRLLAVAAAVGAVVALSATASAAAPQDAEGFGGRHSVREHLSSHNEHPLALSTTGSGHFRATLNERTQEISWQLSYADLSGTITQAHIHFGHAFQAGGIRPSSARTRATARPARSCARPRQRPSAAHCGPPT
ncbi:CHRD domain-containing protein [Kibdelosporangium philippinense]|uniref:CHRD domain-containing protein n=1 Tax=Kibdelosporangium philippinense TaxID=211113 RepID=UPI0024C36AC6|nr:CHRD domain-containing protein [Kibdelosporangium philippinense]